MIKDIDHLALVTCDMERSVKFFTDLLGFKETRRMETAHRGTIILISLGGTQLEILGNRDPGAVPGGDKSVGFTHLALLVDDINAEYARLQAAGIAFSMPPTTLETGLRIAFFQDPDGNILELLQRS